MKEVVDREAWKIEHYYDNNQDGYIEVQFTSFYYPIWSSADRILNIIKNEIFAESYKTLDNVSNDVDQFARFYYPRKLFPFEIKKLTEGLNLQKKRPKPPVIVVNPPEYDKKIKELLIKYNAEDANVYAHFSENYKDELIVLVDIPEHFGRHRSEQIIDTIIGDLRAEKPEIVGAYINFDDLNDSLLLFTVGLQFEMDIATSRY